MLNRITNYSCVLHVKILRPGSAWLYIRGAQCQAWTVMNYCQNMTASHQVPKKLEKNSYSGMWNLLYDQTSSCTQNNYSWAVGRWRTLTSQTYSLCMSAARNLPTYEQFYYQLMESDVYQTLTQSPWKPSWSYTAPHTHSTCLQYVYMLHKTVHLDRLVATKAPLYAYTVDWAFVHITHQWNFMGVCVCVACMFLCLTQPFQLCFDRSQLPCSRSAHGEMFHQLMGALVHEPFDTVLSTVQKASTHTRRHKTIQYH